MGENVCLGSFLKQWRLKETILISSLVVISLLLVLILMELQKIVLTTKQFHVKAKLRQRQQKIISEIETTKKLSAYVDEILFVVTKGYLILDNQERILLKNILYLSRNQNSTTVSTQDEIKQSPIPFSTLVEKLSPNFIQCNDDQIVNINWVIEVTENTIILAQENLVLATDYKKLFTPKSQNGSQY